MSAFVSYSWQDTLRPSLQEKAAIMRNPRSLLAAGGKRLEIELKDHFAKRNGQPNRNGWPKRNFWASIRRATKLTEYDERTATVTVAARELNTHLYGGEITPKRGKYLAIPATQEAYAAGSPREGGLQLQVEVIHMGGGRTALALCEPTATQIKFRRGKRGTKVKAVRETGGIVHYWLTRKATVPRDPDALPSETTVSAAIAKEVRAWLDRNIGSAS